MATAYELVISTMNVTFGEESSSKNTAIILEVDDREDGYNNGITSFKPGDDVYYWMFQGSLITEILKHFTTAGAISKIATESKEIEEMLTFTNSNEATLKYPPSSPVTLEILGRCYKVEKGVVTPFSPTLNVDSQTITTLATNGQSSSSPKIVALVRAKYTTTGDIYLLAVEKQAAIDFKQVTVVAIGQYEK